MQSSPLLHLLGLRALLVQTEQPQINDGIVAQPSRPVRDDLATGSESVLNESFDRWFRGRNRDPQMFGAQTDVIWNLEGRDDLFSRHYDQVPAVFLLYLRLLLLRGVVCHLAGRDEDQYLQIGEMRLRALGVCLNFFQLRCGRRGKANATCNGDSIAGA